MAYSLRVRYDDASKVEKITDDIRAYFESHPGVDLKLPYKASLSDLSIYRAVLRLAGTAPLCVICGLLLCMAIPLQNNFN